MRMQMDGDDAKMDQGTKLEEGDPAGADPQMAPSENGGSMTDDGSMSDDGIDGGMTPEPPTGMDPAMSPD